MWSVLDSQDPTWCDSQLIPWYWKNSPLLFSLPFQPNLGCFIFSIWTFFISLLSLINNSGSAPFFTFLLPLMRAKNSSYAWSLVNCKDSISDSRFMIFNVLIQHWSFNIILFAKMSQLLDVHFPCQCRSLLLLLLLLLFFFLILSHLFWWLLEVMGNRQNIVFFLLFGWKWQCVHPFRWVFQDKAQSCYFPLYSSPSPIKALKYQQCIGAFVC